MEIKFYPIFFTTFISGCTAFQNDNSGILICPQKSTRYVESLIGHPLPQNRDALIATAKKHHLNIEYSKSKKQRSPFCDKSVEGIPEIQIHFPLQENGRIKPLLKFYFDQNGTVIAIEELNQHRPSVF